MTYDDFLPYVLLGVPGCPDELAIQHIRLAAIEFCARTLVWTDETDPLPSVADVSSYAIKPPDDAEIAKLLTVWVGTSEFEVITPSTARTLIRRGSAREFAYSDRSNVILSAAPATVGTPIVCEAAFKPTIESFEVPDMLVPYTSDIAWGAMSSLKRMSKRDWSDVASAALDRGTFDARIATIAIQVAKGFSTARQKTRARFY